MCLTLPTQRVLRTPTGRVSKKQRPYTPKTATRDIIVYKRVNIFTVPVEDGAGRKTDATVQGVYVSENQGFRYREGLAYEAKFDIKPESHSMGMAVYSGLHSYITMPVRHWNITKAIIKCKIPKGAHYFKSSCRTEYASDKLVILGKV